MQWLLRNLCNSANWMYSRESTPHGHKPYRKKYFDKWRSPFHSEYRAKRNQWVKSAITVQALFSTTLFRQKEPLPSVQGLRKYLPIRPLSTRCRDARPSPHLPLLFFSETRRHSLRHTRRQVS